MAYAEMLALAIALGVDITSVSLGLGCTGPSKKKIMQMSVSFAAAAGILIGLGFFLAGIIEQLIMRVLSWLGLSGVLPRGEALCEHIQSLLCVLGAAILFGIGVQLLLVYIRGENGGKRSESMDVKGLLGFFFLAVLVSIDAFSAGLGLGMLPGINWILLVFTVLVVNWAMSFIGLNIGCRLGSSFGRKLYPVGAAMLILVAVKIVFEAFWA
jgi:putative Mn2+ efflux pump MntP